MTKRRRRIAIGIAAATGLALLGAGLILRPVPRLVWNASASAPEGLYFVSPQAPLAVGDFVVARLPARYRRLAAIRRYLPANVPLVKQVAGGVGDQVCGLGRAIFLNGVWLAERRARDGAGRPMPAWQGCIRLGPDDYFLLMVAESRSFDGRYFGVTRRRDIIGRARLLWAR